MLCPIPDSDSRDAFRRRSRACALTPDQDSDVLTVTEGAWSCSSSLKFGVFASSSENADRTVGFGSFLAFINK